MKNKEIAMRVFQKTLVFIEDINNEISRLRNPDGDPHDPVSADIMGEYIDVYVSVYALHEISNELLGDFLKSYYPLLRKISTINPHIETLKDALSYVENNIKDGQK